MKKSVIVILLLGILLVSSLVLAQEKSQRYSGFDRFVDNVKMFFSSGDNKVMLALKIREKELNSAIINTQNGNDEEAEKNLERARKRLQFVQNKVSKDIAADVKTNVDETIVKINERGDLLDSFDAYILEEEKTGLTAELVIEVEGKEGQTLTREIVKDSGSGENKVEVVVEGDSGKRMVEGEIEGQTQEQTRTREIETRMNKIDEQIADIIVGKNQIDTPKKTKDNEDVTPEPNVVDNTVDPGPQGIVGSDHEPGVVDED